MRKIDHLIVHCTATPEGRPVSVAEIDNWHKARGWRDPATGLHIGYHYVVHLDGSVSRGRPDSSIGAHVAGHNSHSLGIVYIGGVDKHGKAKDTRTPEQKVALETILRVLVAKYPIRDISGHNEWAAKACPSFNASAEYDYLLEAPRQPVTEDEFIEQGEAGEHVREWQRKLVAHGYNIEITGVHDEASYSATRWFQSARAILIDGVVGPQTQLEMDNAQAGRTVPAAPPPPDIPLPRPPDIPPHRSPDVPSTPPENAGLWDRFRNSWLAKWLASQLKP